MNCTQQREINSCFFSRFHFNFFQYFFFPLTSLLVDCNSSCRRMTHISKKGKNKKINKTRGLHVCGSVFNLLVGIFMADTSLSKVTTVKTD